ncbi:MAG: hypothetical protein MK209_02375 [Planctomycetes bacterium]|nr:hypothetical protein [Planctomycetota bacterium]
MEYILPYILPTLLILIGVLVILNRRNTNVKVKRVIDKVQRGNAHFPDLLDRLDVLEQRVHAFDLEPLRRDLANLRLSVDGLAEAPPLPDPIAAEKELSRAQEVRGLVERALAARGLTDIRLLNDAAELDAEELHIRVECSRDGLIAKGRVHVVGGEVRAVQLDDSLRQFP